MIRANRIVWSTIAATTLLASAAIAQPGKDKPKDGAKPHGTPSAAPDAAAQPGGDGMDAAMMEAWMKAATPGKMHKHLAKGLGTWDGVVRHWPAPGAPVMESNCITVITPMFDSRFTKSETSGDMPGMGPFAGFGLYGYDNVSEQFQSVWIDNMGTGMMTGTGKLSDNGKVLTWSMNYFDPMTKKPMVMREVDRTINDNSTVLEMYGPGPDGNEFKMMEITYTRSKAKGEHSTKGDHDGAHAGDNDASHGKGKSDHDGAKK